jgi:hypothetical protein
VTPTFCSSRWLAAWLLAMSPLVQANGGSSVTLRAGTEIQLTFADAITSASAIQGQHFNLVVDQDVLQQGRILIPRGTAAVGTVLDAEPSGRGGAGGMLSIKVDYLQLGAQRVRLHWTLSSLDRSQERKGTMLNGLLVGLGTSVKGKEIEIAAGTQIRVTTKENVEIAVAAPEDEGNAVRDRVPVPD